MMKYEIEFMDFDEQTGAHVIHGVVVKADTEAGALLQLRIKYPLAWDAQVVGIDVGIEA